MSSVVNVSEKRARVVVGRAGKSVVASVMQQ